MLYIGWLVITVGFFVIISGIVGLFRFPDFFTKLHAASVIECAGIPITLIGLCFFQTSFVAVFKLLAIIALILLLNPVSTFALGRASLLHKVDDEGRIK